MLDINCLGMLGEVFKSKILRHGAYDLSVIMTLNLNSKYHPLTAMLICPVILVFLINYCFGNYDLKMSKEGRQLTFPYYTKGACQ